MLEFFSASGRIVNPERAVLECLEGALGPDPHAELIIINASIGHDLHHLCAGVRQQLPNARVVAGSCAGVVGREGVSESMKDVGMMAVRGDDFVVSHVSDIHGENARARARELAAQLRGQRDDITMVYLLASGVDIANDEVIAGIEDELGSWVTVFGATTSDNMRGITSYQALDGQVFEHGAIAVGFCDPTLEVVAQATHGFVATGEPLTVTAVRGNRIVELDGEPAWPAYLERLGLDADAVLADSIPIGALAEALSPEEAADYGNAHILRAITHVDDDGALVYATLPREGMQVWLTERDEARIFDDLERLIETMNGEASGRLPVAVFQADCLARGRLLFDRVIKEELVQRMQYPFSDESGPPPWLGMYGFGEYARLHGANAFHNYSTALAAIYRRTDPVGAAA